jgi:hypothetical protein
MPIGEVIEQEEYGWVILMSEGVRMDVVLFVVGDFLLRDSG